MATGNYNPEDEPQADSSNTKKIIRKVEYFSDEEEVDDDDR